MNWRTDKPTADVIVAKIDGHYLALRKYANNYYTDDTARNFIPYYKLVKWADLEEDETVTDIDLIQKSWYRQGYIDGINKQEPQWILENLKYKENPKYGQPLETVTNCHQLDEAARTSWFNYEFDCGALYSKCYKDGFKAGANWQKNR